VTAGALGLPRSHPDYYKTWFAKNRVSELGRIRALRVERRALLDAIKLERGCADCGYRAHAVALDFDHVRGEKVDNVGTLAARSSMARLLAEIEKCEVVCANCHRVRTHARRLDRNREA
jgi:hypothetical protein